MAKCKAKTSTGRRCRKDALEGSDYCALHQPVEQAEVAPEPEADVSESTVAVREDAIIAPEPSATRQVAPARVTQAGVRKVVGLYGAPALEITGKDGTKTRVRTRESLSTFGPIGADYRDSPRPCECEEDDG